MGRLVGQPDELKRIVRRIVVHIVDVLRQAGALVGEDKLEEEKEKVSKEMIIKERTSTHTL